MASPPAEGTIDGSESFAYVKAVWFWLTARWQISAHVNVRPGSYETPKVRGSHASQGILFSRRLGLRIFRTLTSNSCFLTHKKMRSCVRNVVKLFSWYLKNKRQRFLPEKRNQIESLWWQRRKSLALRVTPVVASSYLSRLCSGNQCPFFLTHPEKVQSPRTKLRSLRCEVCGVAKDTSSLPSRRYWIIGKRWERRHGSMHRVPKCLYAHGPFSTLRLCTLRSNRKNSGSLFRPSTRTRRRHRTPASTWSCWGLSRWEGDPHPAPSSSVGHKQHPVTNWRALVCDVLNNANRVEWGCRTTKSTWSVRSANLCCEQNKSFRTGCQSNHKIMVALWRIPPTRTNSVLSNGQVKWSVNLTEAEKMPSKSQRGYRNPYSPPNPLRAHNAKLSDSILSLLPVTHLIIET